MSKTHLSTRLYRVNKLIHLNKPQSIAENYRNLHHILDSRTIHTGQDLFSFTSSDLRLPETFPYEDKSINLLDYLHQYYTSSFLVIKDDQIVFEDYWLGNTPQTLTISWSMAKSILSALIGIALDDGLIDSVHDRVSDYDSLLLNGGYQYASIKDVLQMSSGTHFDEQYDHFFSDINKMARKLAFGGSINKLAASLRSVREPGTYNKYNSMDTQVLGMVLRSACKTNLSDFMSEKIWSRIGTQQDAMWCLDSTGMELAFGGICASTRDFARFARLYIEDGRYKEDQIISKDWIQESITPDKPFLKPGKHPQSDDVFGYAYQWWLPEFSDDDFYGLGINGQSMYINPKRKTIIIRTAADPTWTATSPSIGMTIDLCQFLAKNL